ncbi:hypothetical protein HYPBUDRAFT_3299 [Hyphopichia burtonii NRRL Y-1933]|uniref:Uncharacterized protein n=1 Tax=Hyphopichia burtonii NRRL Y-1933 TaxID=984485 RepID=A0A1E4RPW3_9ASCO|nr:hypothetical protein HYPBUDRAFT_3299 [Hyphopichia burtonii NRRL Y-1933]ODV69307.1 hypothetical protein HYPBUDRAFT_3299 [Hyphopichia burtonii NRRL Y-1933]
MVLTSSAEIAKESLSSADKLLKLTNDLVKDQGNNEVKRELKSSKRQYILDSFKVNKFHKDYQEWENKERLSFINTEVKLFNKKLGEMTRLNDDVEDSEKEFDKLHKNIKLPSFEFSIQTIEQFEDGIYLKYLEKDEEGNYPSKVAMLTIFALDSESGLETPDFSVFNKLLNIEYRLRMQRQIKYEVLLLVKQQLRTKNRKWAARDSSLNQFISRDLPLVFSEVENIKTNEYEDLKDYNDEEDEDLDIDEDSGDNEDDLEKDREGTQEPEQNHEIYSKAQDEISQDENNEIAQEVVDEKDDDEKDDDEKDDDGKDDDGKDDDGNDINDNAQIDMTAQNDRPEIDEDDVMKID